MIRTWFGRNKATMFHWSMEVVIVVIGILIAFALQGWSEDRASAARAVDAERRIREKIFFNAHDFIERLMIYPCLRANVQTLTRDLIANKPGWRPVTFESGIRKTTLAIVYPVPARASSVDVYKGALDGGELARVDPARRADLAVLYGSAARLEAMNQEENVLADRLQPLQLGVTLGTPERNAMLATLARLDSINGLAHLMAEQYLGRLRDDGFRLTRAEIDGHWREVFTDEVKHVRTRYGPCVDARAIGAFEPALLQSGRGDAPR